MTTFDDRILRNFGRCFYVGLSNDGRETAVAAVVAAGIVCATFSCLGCLLFGR